MGIEIFKSFVRGFMDVMILWLLFKKPMHGYEIINKISDLTGLSFTPGSVYPLLYKLEKKGLIKSRWKKTGERQKIKLYEITKKGLKILENLSIRLQSFLRDLASYKIHKNPLLKAD